MGQAKLRGSFETRKAEGEVKDAAILLERKRLAAEREAAMTPAQRKSRENTLAYLAAMLGFAAGGRY